MVPSAVGLVVIGRNEGERLLTCLRSIPKSHAVVYVDSGSTDGSQAQSRTLGFDVVELDPTLPFTAARARNEGFARLRATHPHVRFVQFLDGDTELAAGWLERALQELSANPAVVAVCGRRRERHPDASAYNLLCEIEWNTAVGEATAFGGDVMIRVDDFERAGGYDRTLIAGEDPDLALRLRRLGGRILRLDAEMTLHDADLHSFSQWWRRAVRGGHAYAEGAHRHGGSGPEHFWRKEVRSNWAWGAALPVLGLTMSVPTLGTSLFAAAGGYATLFAKIQRDARRRGLGTRESRVLATFTTIAKIPLALGQAKYWLGKASGKRSGLIEYKR